MVAYLILVGVILTILVVGIAYNFTSDFLFYILNSINGYEGTPLADNLDVETTQGLGFLMVLFQNILIVALFSVAYFSWTMSQKMQKNW